MRIEMTEEEAREKCSRNTKYPVCDLYWKALKETFELEFAPEPVKLPELIALSAPDKHDPFLPNHGTILNDGVRIAIIPAGWSEASVRECRVILGEAVTRYNAYSGLRAAAARFIEVVKPSPLHKP